MKILIVDDERFNLRIAEGFIHNIMPESEIVLCNDPKKVINIICNCGIDIVFLDIMMPEVNGIEVLEEIRKVHGLDDIQIIMLTALSDQESFKKCFDLGADDYLFKPINAVELQARLKAAVKTRRNSKLISNINEQLKIQNHELQEVNKELKDIQYNMIQKEKLAAIGELAAGVAHEINNPLGYIGSNVETLNNFFGKLKEVLKVYKTSLSSLEEVKNFSNQGTEYFENAKDAEKKYKLEFVMDEYQDTINDILEGLKRVEKIVKTLKDFARAGLENERTLNSLNNIIEEVLLITNSETKYSIDITRDFQEVPYIECNRSQVGQVILNILMNAIQAIKSQKRDDRGNIIIKTGSQNGKVYLRIEDDGPGIRPDLLNRIFDPFFTTKDVGQGTGLGLSISFDIIVNKHNGEIDAGNNSEKGAYFMILFPLKS